MPFIPGFSESSGNSSTGPALGGDSSSAMAADAHNSKSRAERARASVGKCIEYVDTRIIPIPDEVSVVLMSAHKTIELMRIASIG